MNQLIPTEAQERAAISFHRFVIPYRLPSYNEATRADRTHKQQGARMRRDVEQGIMWEIKEAHVQPITNPCIVSMTFVEGDHRRDVDNVESAKKYILDALVKAGTLQGDSPKYVIAAPSFTEYGNGARVIVTIIDSGDKDRLQELVKTAQAAYKEGEEDA